MSEVKESKIQQEEKKDEKKDRKEEKTKKEKKEAKKKRPNVEKEYAEYLIDCIQCEQLKKYVSNNLLWYIKQAKRYKYFYFTVVLTSIIADSLSAYFALVFRNHSWIAAIFASVAGILISVNALFRIHENWTRYRQAAENMKDILSDFTIIDPLCEKRFNACCRNCTVYSQMNNPDSKTGEKQDCTNGDIKKCWLYVKLLRQLQQVKNSEFKAWQEQRQKDDHQ